MSKYIITMNGKKYELEIELADGSAAPITAEKTTSAPTPAPQSAKPAAQSVSSSGGSKVTSPMPGTILAVNVSVGDTVTQGQAVLVLEAMKMENEITAAKDGVIIALHVKQGDSVQGGAVLFEIGE